MGGRGAYSYTGGNEKLGPATDLTSKYTGMSLHEFENTIRHEKYEIAGIFDKTGTLLKATTNNDSGSVGIPRMAGAYTVTHNHPIEDNRMIGGTLSGVDADAHLLVKYNLNSIRAVSHGPNENTYILRRKSGSKQDEAAFVKYLNKYTNKTETAKQYARAVNAVKNKKLTPKQLSQVGYGSLKHWWKSGKISKYGFEYVEVKKSHW